MRKSTGLHLQTCRSQRYIRANPNPVIRVKSYIPGIDDSTQYAEATAPALNCGPGYGPRWAKSKP
jgi:hypothetical protein